MKIKSLIIFMVYLLLLSVLPVPVRATAPPPDCSGCCLWSSYWSDCVDADVLCGPCCDCQDCSCVPIPSRCDSAKCYECIDCQCKQCGGDPNQQCCPDKDPNYCCPSNKTCCKGECCDPNHDCCNGECCEPNEFCCNGNCCPDHKCCVDGVCIRGHCTPMFDLVESGECECYAFECEGSITETFIWYCAEGYYGDGDCPSGTECRQTGTIECFTTRTRYCIGECLTSGSECALSDEYIWGTKAPRVLCGCCPIE